VLDIPDTPRFSADLEAYLRTQVAASHPPRRVAPRVVAGVLSIAILGSVLGVTGVLGGGSQAQATAFVVGDDIVAISALTDPARHEELQRRFAQAGGELVVERRPVAPQSVGQVLGISLPRGVRADGDHLVDASQLPGPVVVTLGVLSPSPTTAGAPIYGTLPDLCELVEPTDAPASVAALRGAGYDVDVKLIEFVDDGARARDVGQPPEGTLVIGVMDRDGENQGVTPDTRQLIVEVGSGGDGHYGQTDSNCILSGGSTPSPPTSPQSGTRGPEAIQPRYEMAPNRAPARD
jgi:hypothetical protein